MKTVLITGGSSGFGKAIAEKFSQNNWNCIITGRNEEKLQEVKNYLEEKYNNKIFSLKFDVSKENEVDVALDKLPNEFKKIDVLINNAGSGIGLAPFEEMSLDDINSMIDVNIKGVLFISHKIISQMIQRKSGHIINIGSTAGKIVGKGQNVYSLTKYAIDAFTKGLRIDLMKYKIKVSSINPGRAKTNFALNRFKGDIEKAKNAYTEFEPLNPEDVANSVYFCVDQNENVCIEDLTIAPLAQSSVYIEKEKI